MIKVNLLRNMGLAKGGTADQAEAVAPETARLAVAKVIAILTFPLLLYIYERVNLNEAEVSLHGVQEKVQSVKNERAKFGDAGPKIEMYNKEKARVDKELEVVRTIARNRLREVKALDAIQSLMPLKTWTKKLSIDGNVVKLEGYTSSNDGVSDLIRALEANVYFSKVEPKYTTQEDTPNGPVKKFELEFRIGKQE
jgi:Tfp pilus assembly protein PilN